MHLGVKWQSPCCTEKCQSSSPRDMATQYATIESGDLQHLGISFKTGSTGCMIWRSWQNVCWGSGGCWTTPSSWQWLHSGVVVWVHFVFVWMVDFLNTKFWTCDHLVCFVRFIDTGLRKFDRQAPINMCKVLILSEMCYFLHSTVATKRMSGRKFSYCVPWHSLAKWCTKNCENSFTFVKVTAKKSVALF